MIYSLSERAKLTKSEKEEFERQSRNQKKKNGGENDTNSISLGVREGDSLGPMANKMHEKKNHSQKSRKGVSFNKNCYYQGIFLKGHCIRTFCCFEE